MTNFNNLFEDVLSTVDLLREHPDGLFDDRLYRNIAVTDWMLLVSMIFVARLCFNLLVMGSKIT